MAAIRERDQIIHLPYQAFDHVANLLNEAATNPAVEELWLTVYRVARDSSVLSALLAAVVVDENPRALGRERARAGRADAAGRAGHEHCLPLKPGVDAA